MRILIFYAVVTLILGCHSKSKLTEPTFKAFTEIEPSTGSPSLVSLFQKYKQLTPPTHTPTLSWQTGWTFQLGAIDETLYTQAKSVEGSEIDLPHRIDKPDCSIWYKKEIQIPTDGLIRIQSDDGAQLFVAGLQVARLNENYFPIKTGTYELVIRVLNNAMSGGLRGVSFLSMEEYHNYSNQLADFYELKRSVEKVLLLQKPTQKAIDYALHALANAGGDSANVLIEYTRNLPCTTGPWIQRNTSDSFVIKAWIERSATVQLQYGFSPDSLNNLIEKTCDLCEFELPQIPANVQVYYQFNVEETVTPLYHFSAKEEDSFSFNVWADSQSGWESFRKNIQNALNFDDAFGIGVGDLVGNGSIESEWRMFYNILSSSAAERQYYLIAGNHDYDGYYDDLTPAHYNRLVGSPSYQSWTYSNCAFIALDPNERFPIGIPKGSQQYNWFLEQLESEQWRLATWRFILVHQPPYSQGWAGYEGDKVVQDLLDPLIELAKIDFVISGHTHDYERLTKMYGNQQTTFLVMGGAGGSLEPEESSLHPKMDTVIKLHHMGRFFIEGSKLRFEIRGLENQLLDSFEFKK